MAARKTAARKSTKKKRLGMGLSGMIGAPVEVSPPAESSAASAQASAPSAVPAEGLSSVSVSQIRPNDRQPRQSIDASALEPLVASIRSAGVMQPVVVRPAGADGVHELVAGERRWRAAQAAGLKTVPAVVRNIDDRTAAEWAIIENIQREDLNAVERGDAFRQLQADFGLTHAEIAEQVGLTRAAVTNQIRLCELDEGIRSLIRSGSLSGGHGRCLLSLESIDQRLLLAKEAIKEEWSVRELEQRVRRIASSGGERGTKGGASKGVDRTHLDDLERQLSEHLGTQVRIRTGRKRDQGELRLAFYDLAQFDGLLDRMGFTPS